MVEVLALLLLVTLPFASQSAFFCFPEVTLGLIPAIISPYIIKALGERTALAFFLSAKAHSSPASMAVAIGTSLY